MPMKHQDPETHAGMSFIAIYFVTVSLLLTMVGVVLAFN